MDSPAKQIVKKPVNMKTNDQRSHTICMIVALQLKSLKLDSHGQIFYDFPQISTNAKMLMPQPFSHENARRS
jgi:hypothetical protein